MLLKPQSKEKATSDEKVVSLCLLWSLQVPMARFMLHSLSTYPTSSLHIDRAER